MAEMSFHCRVAELSIKHKLRSSDTREGLREDILYSW